MTSRCQGLFPPLPISKGKALGTRLMADVNDLFFFGDDFDPVLDILEIDEELEEQFTEAVDEVSMQSFLTLYINLKYGCNC